MWNTYENQNHASRAFFALDMIGKDIAEYWYPYQLNYLDNALERLEVANVQSDLHRLWILEGYI